MSLTNTAIRNAKPVAQSIRGVEGRMTRQIRNRRGTKNG